MYAFPPAFGFLPGVRVSQDGVPSVGDVRLQQGIAGEFLYMEAVDSPYGIGKTAFGDKAHGI